jgi:hypothetical protein
MTGNRDIEPSRKQDSAKRQKKNGKRNREPRPRSAERRTRPMDKIEMAFALRKVERSAGMLRASVAEEWILSTKLEKQVRRLLMSPAGRAALKTYGVDVEIVEEEEAMKGEPCGLGPVT